MLKHLTPPSSSLRCTLAALTATTFFVTATGLTSVIEAVKTTTAKDTSVVNETDVGRTSGITLPGTLTNRAQVSLAEVPEGYIEATEKALVANALLPHSAVSSYPTGTGTQTFIRIDSAQGAKEYRFPLRLTGRNNKRSTV